MSIQVTQSKQSYILQAPYDISELKTLGAKRISEGWKMPAYIWSLQAVSRLVGKKELRVSASIVADYKREYGFPIHDLSDLARVRLTEEVWQKLWEYQQRLVVYLMASPHPGTLINMDPGLGKTFASIVAAHALGYKRILIVAPLTFLQGWADEIKDTFSNQHIQICHQRGPAFYNNGEPEWVITNYDTIIRLPELFYRDFDVMIVDESVAIKNRKTQRVAKLLKVRKHVKKVWLLSGSPITKYADDLFAQFQLIDPHAFRSYWRFAEMYCVLQKTPWATVVVSNRRRIDIRREFKDLMYVAKEHEVFDIRQPKFHVIECPLQEKQQEIFAQMTKDFIADLTSHTLETTAIIAKLAYLQQIVSNPLNIDEEWKEKSGKEDMLYDMLHEGEIELPAIVWTWYRKTGQRLTEVFKLMGYKTSYIAGGSKDRAEVIEKFQDGRIDILVLSLGVGKYGLTLSNAKSVVYYDRTFDADTYIQSLARVSAGLRGIDKEELHEVFILHSSKTTDDLIVKNLKKKAVSIAHVSQAELTTLIRGFTGGQL